MEAARCHLGDGFPRMLDASMALRADGAVRGACRLAASDPLWLEEPVVPEDFDGHVRVQREAMVAGAAGENLRSLHEFRLPMERGGVGFPETDVTDCGGIPVFLDVAHLACAHCLPVTSHGAQDPTVHLLAALPNRSFPEVHGFALDVDVEEPLRIRDGFALAPERPGHGIAFRREALAGHRQARARGRRSGITRPPPVATGRRPNGRGRDWLRRQDSNLRPGG